MIQCNHKMCNIFTCHHYFFLCILYKGSDKDAAPRNEATPHLQCTSLTQYMLFLDRRTLQLPRLWPQTGSHDNSGSSYIRLSVCVCVCVCLQCNLPQTDCTRWTNNKDDPCQLPIYTRFPFYFYSVLLPTLWPFLSTFMTRKWNWQLCFCIFYCWLEHKQHRIMLDYRGNTDPQNKSRPNLFIE